MHLCACVSLCLPVSIRFFPSLCYVYVSVCLSVSLFSLSILTYSATHCLSHLHGREADIALAPVIVFGKNCENLPYRKARILQFGLSDMHTHTHTTFFFHLLHSGATNYTHSFSQLIETMINTLQETATADARNKASIELFK